MVWGDGLTLGVSSPPTDRGRGSAQDASKDGFSQLCPHRQVPETLHCTKKRNKEDIRAGRASGAPHFADGRMGG